MTNSFNDTQSLLQDVEIVHERAIVLDSSQIDHAVQLSTQIPHESRQWQAYLNTLALYSVEQWLQEQAPNLPIHQQSCSILQPQLANVIEAVANLEVGDFKLCLLATGTLSDDRIALPQAVIDLPEYTAHFYMVIEILEEQEQAQIQGFLRYDQLLSQLLSTHVQASTDWTYELPLSWFNPDANQLLLYLRCLEPTAIALPAIPTTRAASLAQIQGELMDRLPQLQSPQRSLWQVLNWEEGEAVLTSPALLTWLYHLQRGEQSIQDRLATVMRQVTQGVQALTQQTINVGLWFQDTLDMLAQNVSWVLLPALTPEMVALRSGRSAISSSPAETIEAILEELRQTGMEIPAQVRAAYQDLQLAGTALRLSAAVWPIQALDSPPEWSLLVLLGVPSETRLPQNLKLQISDQSTVLVERVVTVDDEAYLYACVIGTADEQFSITLSLANGASLTLPPLAFITQTPL
jgi:hypothetical protein